MTQSHDRSAQNSRETPGEFRLPFPSHTSVL
jgi:hypothetical protein